MREGGGGLPATQFSTRYASEQIEHKRNGEERTVGLLRRSPGTSPAPPQGEGGGEGGEHEKKINKSVASEINRKWGKKASFF